MTDQRTFIKSRCIWQPGALRLLREPRCIAYARRVVPDSVGGMRIVFPETKIGLGPRISVRSEWLDGSSLLDLLYQPNLGELAVDLGLTALGALQGAIVAPHPAFTWFSWMFRLSKGPRLVFRVALDPGGVSRCQMRELGRLFSRYVGARNEHRVLVGRSFRHLP